MTTAHKNTSPTILNVSLKRLTCNMAKSTVCSGNDHKAK